MKLEPDLNILKMTCFELEGKLAGEADKQSDCLEFNGELNDMLLFH